MPISEIDFSGIGILVVDDEEFIRQLLARMLRELKVKTVIAAADAADAGIKLKIHGTRISLIICDIMMPNVSGLEFVKSVRAGKTAADPNMPVLLLSGEGSEEMVLAAAELKVQGYIRKPVSLETLGMRIAWAMTHPLAQGQLEDQRQEGSP